MAAYRMTNASRTFHVTITYIMNDEEKMLEYYEYYGYLEYERKKEEQAEKKEKKEEVTQTTISQDLFRRCSLAAREKDYVR